MLTFVDRVGQHVGKGDRLTNAATRCAEATCLGFTNQKWITLAVKGADELYALDREEFKRSTWIRTPQTICRFIDVKGKPISVGDRLLLAEGEAPRMMADVIAVKYQRLELCMWYTVSPAKKTVTDLTWAELLHAGWTLVERQHGVTPVIRYLGPPNGAVPLESMIPKSFFMMDGNLYQVIRHSSLSTTKVYHPDIAATHFISKTRLVSPVETYISVKNGVSASGNLFLFNHGERPSVSTKSLSHGQFFMWNEQLCQAKDHNSAGWANCHNLTTGYHFSLDWAKQVIPVNLHIETQ